MNVVSDDYAREFFSTRVGYSPPMLLTALVLTTIAALAIRTAILVTILAVIFAALLAAFGARLLTKTDDASGSQADRC